MTFNERTHFGEARDPLEVWEDLALMWNLQTERAAAEKLNGEIIRVAKEHNQPTDLRYVLFRPFDEVIPIGTDKIIEETRPNEEYFLGIDRLILNFPSAKDKSCPPPPDGEWWNDVFIEVERDEVVTERYLLNGNGLQPYETADDIDRLPLGVAQQDRNLFLVRRPAYQAYPLGAGEINKLIAQYRIARQTSRDY